MFDFVSCVRVCFVFVFAVCCAILFAMNVFIYNVFCFDVVYCIFHIYHDPRSQQLGGCIHLQQKRGTSFVCLALPPHHLFAYDATQKIPNLFFYNSSERPFVNKKNLILAGEFVIILPRVT